MTERQDWQDTAKGLGIVLVVFGHVAIGLRAASILPANSGMENLLYAIYLFHMPLFFLLSGINVERSLARGNNAFLREKIWTIVYPYFLWSLVQGGIQVGMSGSLNASMTLADLGRIGWAPFAQFWFLYALAVCHLLMVVFRHTGAGMVAIGLAAAIVSPYLPPLPDISLHHFFFYACGFVFSRQLKTMQARPYMLLPLVAAFALAALVNAWQAGLRYDLPSALPAGVTGIGIVLVLSMLLKGPVAQLLQALGRMSMTIYILHILAAAGARVLLLKLGVAPEPWLYTAISTLSGIVVPVFAHWLFAALRILPWLGLAAPRRDKVPVDSASQAVPMHR